MKTIESIIATLDHIEAHLDEPLTLETVADELGYSRYHLHRMFTRTLGLTMHAHIRRRQLTEAARLLVFSRQPIIEIAFQTGYESQQAFSSVFKSMYKLPPHRFRESKKFYPLQLPFEFDETMIRAHSVKQHGEQTIMYAHEDDISEWMRLVRLVVDGFPYLNEHEYIDTLKCYIARKCALIMKDGEVTVGIMMLSYKEGSIDFWGIHPLYRNRGIAQAFLVQAMSGLSEHDEISITTYRDGDKADTGYRKALKELGFIEGELLVEFGYPTQKLTIAASTLRDKQMLNEKMIAANNLE